MTRTTKPKPAAKPAPSVTRETSWSIPAVGSRSRVKLALEDDAVKVTTGGNTVAVPLALFVTATAELYREADVTIQARVAREQRAQAEANAVAG